MSAAVIFAGVYGMVLGLLFAFGINGYALLWLRRRFEPPRSREPASWPRLAVQIPVYNERDVVARVIAAAGRLEYPGLLEVQVLDDSDDDTPAVAAAALRELERAGVAVDHVRRRDRVGFKAGALEDGLVRTDAELLLILDADFVPEPDFLLRTVPYLCEPDVACVQTRWGHLNREHGPLTRGQALGIDVHFLIEQRARAAAGWTVAFNGSGGVWRRAALEDAGGWSADTLTEDLDLSYRAWLAGWRIVYAHDVTCPAEIPERILAFKAQQRRWARGSTATALKLLGRIWRAPRSFGAKIQATLHLTHYCVHPLMLMSAALALPLGWLGSAGSSWWTILPPLAMATGGPVTMALVAGADEGLPIGRRLRELGVLMLLGTGLALSNTLAVISGALRGGGVFERTAKGGRRSSYLSPGDGLGIAEMACAAACAALAAWLVACGIYTMAPFLVLYAAGLSRVGIATLREGWQGRVRSAALEVGV